MRLLPILRLLLGGAFVVWLWLTGRALARRNDARESNPKEN